MSPTAPSWADANRASIEADDVAELQLPAASAIDLAVHGHKTVGDGLFHVSTGVEESSKLQELPEPNDLTTDRDILDRNWIRHPRMLVDRVPPRRQDVCVRQENSVARGGCRDVPCGEVLTTEDGA